MLLLNGGALNDADLLGFTVLYISMLTVEDGSQVDGADTYVDLDYVAAYALKLGLTWDGTLTEREQAIARSMIYLEAFEKRYCGQRVGTVQDTAWPRSAVPDLSGQGYVATDTIPKRIKDAQAEGAIIELANPGTLLQAAAAVTGAIKRQRKKMGPMETESEYFEGATAAETKNFERLKALIAPYLKTKAKTLIRA